MTETFSIAAVFVAVVVILGKENVKLSLKVDAASTKAHGLQDTWFVLRHHEAQAQLVRPQ